MNLVGKWTGATRRLGAALMLGALGISPATPAPPALARTLVVLGDSLSAGYGIRVEDGWVALLERRLAAQGYGYRVVNASVSGETTAGGIARLPRVLSVHQPALVVIELGANDGLRGLPVAELRQNLSRLVAGARATGAQVLLVGIRMPANYGQRYTEELYASYGVVAAAQHVALVPFLLEGIDLDDQNFQADRLHPVAAVQARLLDTVWRGLRPLLGRPRPQPRGVR